MKRSSLQQIEPPSKDRGPEVVAREILEKYRSEYHFTVKYLCEVLCCDRQWIEDFILENVRHIFVNKFFRSYIIEKLSSEMTKTEIHDFTYAFYFVSEEDLIRFYNEKAEAHRKTEMRDLAIYKRPSASLEDLINERSRHHSIAPNVKEKKRHLAVMRDLLTDEGYAKYTASTSTKWEWIPSPLPPLPVKPREPHLISAAKYARRENISSGMYAYGIMSRNGAVRIKFGGKTLWKLPDETGTWMFPVQYE